MESINNLINVLLKVKEFFQQLDEIDDDNYDNRNDYEYWLVVKKNFFNVFDYWVNYYNPKFDNICCLYDFFEYLYNNVEKFNFKHEEIDEFFVLFKNYLIEINEK